MAVPAGLKWQPLELLGQRFGANVAALALRDPALAGRLAELKPSAPFFIAAQGDEIYLGRPGMAGIEVVSNPLPPAAARNMAAGVFPSGHVTWPVVVAGLAYGWLWDRIAKLPCKVETAPGHRPPIYLLTKDIERLWAVLHVLELEPLMADPRFVLYVGPDAGEQLQRALIDNPTWPMPRACIGIEPGLFQTDFNTLVTQISERRDKGLAELKRKLEAIYPPVPTSIWARRLKSGRLRVLGITSRFTTFLQHSMRDWLAAFERLGHETRLAIEPADHLVLGPFGFAQAVLDYRPDLIVVIDHYRAELGALPDSVPCVMWVQDRLPNIYCPQAGQNQKERDYCLGFGRLHLSSKHGYPAERFLASPMGINEERFEQCELSVQDLSRFGCDVSYVSHASTPAGQIVREYIQKCGSRELGRLLDDMYQRLEAWFAGGGAALSEVALRGILQQSMESSRVTLDERAMSDTILFFNQGVCNAMFRHQTLEWLAGMDINLHLWGNGWEKHPILGRFARGAADNQNDLPKIYRASRINLQVTPHGVVHQRLLDGLAAGGFFLLRWHPGDAVGPIYQELLAWCQRHGVSSDVELHAKADGRIGQLIERINELEGSTPQTRQMSVFDVMNGHADMKFMGTAASIWEEYGQVTFNTRDELAAKVRHFLSDDSARRQIAASMRQAVIERFSYVSISRSLLNFIADDLAARSEKCAA